MSDHVLLNLLNELGKNKNRQKMRPRHSVSSSTYTIFEQYSVFHGGGNRVLKLATIINSSPYENKK